MSGAAHQGTLRAPVAMFFVQPCTRARTPDGYMRKLARPRPAKGRLRPSTRAEREVLGHRAADLGMTVAAGGLVRGPVDHQHRSVGEALADVAAEDAEATSAHEGGDVEEHAQRLVGPLDAVPGLDRHQRAAAGLGRLQPVERGGHERHVGVDEHQHLGGRWRRPRPGRPTACRPIRSAGRGRRRPWPPRPGRPRRSRRSSDRRPPRARRPGPAVASRWPGASGGCGPRRAPARRRRATAASPGSVAGAAGAGATGAPSRTTTRRRTERATRPTRCRQR